MNTLDRLVLAYLRKHSGEYVEMQELKERFGEDVEKSIIRLWKAWKVELLEVGDNYGSIVYVRYPASLIL